MFKRRFRLPSPALVISMVTLSLVLGGTAVAATVTSHSDAKADTKLVKKLASGLRAGRVRFQAVVNGQAHRRLLGALRSILVRKKDRCRRSFAVVVRGFGDYPEFYALQRFVRR